MKFAKTIVFLVVWLCLSPAMYLTAAGNSDIQDVAERFVRQIECVDTSAILQSYPMTDEFRACVPNAATVTGWSSEIDQLFGHLGDIVHSEIVDHEQNLRSIYLYFQGTKRPAKIWVTFSGMTIAGLHWDIWAEGYTERERSVQRSIEMFDLLV